MTKPIPRVLLNKAGEYYYIADPSKDYHNTYGFIRAAELQSVPNGTKVTTSKGAEFTIFDATAEDKSHRITRGAAIIIPKDAGIILSNTYVTKDSVCVDAGGGSGALTCFLAQYTKKVFCYDIRQDHLDTVKKNVGLFELNNVELAIQNVYDDIPAKDVDLITLDVPEPHKALDHVAKSLKPGGFLVCYVPQTYQVHDLVKAVIARPDMIMRRTIEIIQREWDVDEKKCRPANQGLMHTAFLTFIRKI